MTLHEWAARWGISQQAFAELVACSIVDPEPDALVSGKTEAYVQSAIRLEAPQRGVYLWRNNSGAGIVANARDLCPECAKNARRPIRWGLGNDSKKVNEVMKSADLIGVKPVRIAPDMVGSVIGQFVSRECKRADWSYSGTLEENAQLAWSTLINSLGGNAAIVKAVGSL
jgi:hypothetical protein